MEQRRGGRSERKGRARRNPKWQSGGGNLFSAHISQRFGNVEIGPQSGRIREKISSATNGSVNSATLNTANRSIRA